MRLIQEANQVYRLTCIPNIHKTLRQNIDPAKDIHTNATSNPENLARAPCRGVKESFGVHLFNGGRDAIMLVTKV